MADPILKISQSKVVFDTPGGELPAVDGVNLEVFDGEAVAVVGESGCGKTTLARAVLGLQPLDEGEITVKGKPLIAGQKDIALTVGMVWQDPFASIEPLWRIRRILEEPFRLTGKTPDIEKVMDDVGLDRKLIDRYPHQLSGGQRQRVAIGRALALRPPLVICDEPTAALDLSIQAQILNLLKDIQENTGCAFLYISHDLLTVRYLAQRVAVMYMGQIVEQGPTEEVFSHPQHPYTKALIESAPSLENLGVIPPEAEGEIPDPRQDFPGCKYEGRCAFKTDLCLQKRPSLEGEIHQIRCYHPLGKSKEQVSNLVD